MQVIIEGVLRTVSPLHISAPGEHTHTPDGMKTAFPCTRTRTMPVYAPEAANRFGGMIEVPVVPATTLRGRLRREAARVVEECVAGKGELPDWQTYQMLHSGAISGKPKTIDSLETHRVLRNHVFLGLFGSSHVMTAGRLTVGEAWLVAQPLIDIGIIPEDLNAEPVPGDKIFRVLDAKPVLRIDDITQFRDPNAPNFIANYERTVYDLLEQTAQNRKNRKDKQDKRNRNDAEGNGGEEVADVERGLRTMAFQQVVVPGTPFWWSARITDGTEAQAGLFLMALERILSSEKGIGGANRLGYGRLAHDLTLTVDGRVVTPFRGQGGNTQLNMDEPAVAELVDAASAAIDEETAGSLRSIAAMGV